MDKILYHWTRHWTRSCTSQYGKHLTVIDHCFDHPTWWKPCCRSIGRTCCCSLEKPKIYILISCFGFHHLETDLIKHPKTSGRESKTKDALTPSKDALTPLLMGNTFGMEVGHLLDERQALGRLTLGKCIFMNFPVSKRQMERGVGFKFTKKIPNKW